MGIEHKGCGGKGKMRSESKKGKRNQKKSSQVQRLYEVCKEVFADCGPAIVPSPDKVQKLAAVLDGMAQADVGLTPNMPIFSSEQDPTIKYMHLHECHKFSVCNPPLYPNPLRLCLIFEFR